MVKKKQVELESESSVENSSDTESECSIEVKSNSKKKALVKVEPENSTENFFEFKGHKFNYYAVEQEVYFKAKEIATFLDYKDTKQAISKNVHKEDTITLDELLKSTKNLKGGVCQTPPLNYQKNTIYINESGLYSLIFGSKKKEAKEFKRFVTKEVLPSIRKYGFYSVQPALILTTEMIDSFCDENELSIYLNVNVVYIILIGFDLEGKMVCKFGHSGDFKERFKSHQKTYGNQIKILYIGRTNDQFILTFICSKYI